MGFWFRTRGFAAGKFTRNEISCGGGFWTNNAIAQASGLAALTPRTEDHARSSCCSSERPLRPQEPPLAAPLPPLRLFQSVQAEGLLKWASSGTTCMARFSTGMTRKPQPALRMESFRRSLALKEHQSFGDGSSNWARSTLDRANMWQIAAMQES